MKATGKPGSLEPVVSDDGVTARRGRTRKRCVRGYATKRHWLLALNGVVVPTLNGRRCRRRSARERPGLGLDEENDRLGEHAVVGHGLAEFRSLHRGIEGVHVGDLR